MALNVLTDPTDIESMAEALEAAGDYARAADEYARAGELYAINRSLGEAAHLGERARTCRRATLLRPFN